MDKVAAYHRAKRAVNSNKNPYNVNTNPINKKEQEQKRYEARRLREIKEAKDKRRRQYLEDRRRRLKALRLNPTEFRRQQWKLPMEHRRASYRPSQSPSRSLQVKSKVNKPNEQLIQAKNINRKASSEQKPNRIRNRKRNQGKKRRKRNCATKEPRYLWKTPKRTVEHRNERRNKFDKVSNIDQITIKLDPSNLLWIYYVCYYFY